MTSRVLDRAENLHIRSTHRRRCARRVGGRTSLVVIGCVAALLAGRTGASAQLRFGVTECETGQAGFVDEEWDNRLALGGVVRAAVTRQLATGLEAVHLRGTIERHVVTVTSSGTYDLTRSINHRRVVPFIVLAVGWSRRTEPAGGGPEPTTLRPLSSTGPTAPGGLGACVSLSPHWYIPYDRHAGWEPERRRTVAVGWRPR